MIISLLASCYFLLLLYKPEFLDYNPTLLSIVGHLLLLRIQRVMLVYYRELSLAFISSFEKLFAKLLLFFELTKSL